MDLGPLTDWLSARTGRRGAVGVAALAAGALAARPEGSRARRHHHATVVVRISDCTIPAGAAFHACTADCNAGEIAIGGGFNGASTPAVITGSYPNAAPGPATGWILNWQNASTTLGADVANYVVCQAG